MEINKVKFNIINFETYVGAKNDLLMKYENYIMISTLEELIFYSMYRKNLAYENILEMRKLYDKHCDIGLENFLQHFTKDAYAGIAFRKGASENIDMAQAVDEIMADMNQLQLSKLREGNIVLINSNGGYFYKPEKELKITKRVVLIDDQIISWFNTKQKLLDCILHDLENTPITRAGVSFVQTIEGRVYNHKLIYNHDAICKYYGLDCDKVIKYDYNPKHKNTKCELGIAGLSYSIVYDQIDLPFTPTSSHVNAIDKFIKNIGKLCVKEY